MTSSACLSFPVSPIHPPHPPNPLPLPDPPRSSSHQKLQCTLIHIAHTTNFTCCSNSSTGWRVLCRNLAGFTLQHFSQSLAVVVWKHQRAWGSSRGSGHIHTGVVRGPTHPPPAIKHQPPEKYQYQYIPGPGPGTGPVLIPGPGPGPVSIPVPIPGPVSIPVPIPGPRPGQGYQCQY